MSKTASESESSSEINVFDVQFTIVINYIFNIYEFLVNLNIIYKKRDGDGLYGVVLE